MPLLSNNQKAQFVSGPPPIASIPDMAAASGLPGGNAIVVDGTPVRVAAFTLAAAAGLAALRWAGFRFNVGVG